MATHFCVSCDCHVIYQLNLLLLVLMVLISQYCDAASVDIPRRKHRGLHGLDEEGRVFSLEVLTAFL